MEDGAGRKVRYTQAAPCQKLQGLENSAPALFSQ